ncbi:YbdK family carboxylate-amine ligase [Kluyvera intermedia]|jgi:carboxylate-amine ligase|uniref:YbdK family carboxylate-amine ligase n=1 Tax=Kluyvera intermedia TaxID=61648 RepID=UPI00242E3431|nr:YbdK family carboxylate-amine ligase [Kluyvera intermedia]WEJ84752.1 MAG: YbdK family carboxylate-amine ligase [Kluyvera intermedia]
MNDIPFTASATPSLGIELELQLINLIDGHLSDKSLEIIPLCNDDSHIKKELTLSTIELNSSVHDTPFTLYEEINTLARKVATIAADKQCGLCGGGRHFSNIWKNQTITPSKRYAELHELQGFLAKLSCVFGQHIHVGVGSGNDAIYLCHALIPYLPHFIALSASSPYYQSEDTGFDSSRFSALNSFHTFGQIERDIDNWHKFIGYVEECTELGVIRSQKDIYWEVRPKPELGTVEIRVCDTPLTLFHAAMLGGYAQLLVKYLLKNRVPIAQARNAVTHANAFYAQRYGFEALYIDINKRIRIPLTEHIQDMFSTLENGANVEEKKVLSYLSSYVQHGVNDASRLREKVQSGMSELEVLSDLMEMLLPTAHITHSPS